MIPAIVERCAGIDVGKTFLTVCLLTGPADGEPRAETRKFGTFYADLQALRRWLNEERCTRVVMESTGCYQSLLRQHRLGTPATCGAQAHAMPLGPAVYRALDEGTRDVGGRNACSAGSGNAARGSN